MKRNSPSRFDSLIDRADDWIDNRLPQDAESIRRRHDRIKRPLGVAAIAALTIGGINIAKNFVEVADEHIKSTHEQAVEFNRQAEKAQWQLDHGYVEIDTPDMDPSRPDAKSLESD